MAVPLPTLGHYQGDSHTQLILCSGFLHFWPKCHQEVWSLSLAECLVGFEWGTFWFWLQCLNPVGHADIELYWVVEKFCVTWKAISHSEPLVTMKISDTPLFWNNPTYFTHSFIFMQKIWTPFFENFKTWPPPEADNFGCLRFHAFDFQFNVQPQVH